MLGEETEVEVSRLHPKSLVAAGQELELLAFQSIEAAGCFRYFRMGVIPYFARTVVGEQGGCGEK